MAMKSGVAGGQEGLETQYGWCRLYHLRASHHLTSPYVFRSLDDKKKVDNLFLC